MVEFLVVSSSLMGIAVAMVVRQFLLYPFHWSRRRHAFFPEHGDERRKLHAVRLERRRVNRDGRRKIAKAKQLIAATEREEERQIRVLEGEREERLRPVNGEQRKRFGELVLYEHTLQFMQKSQDGQDVLVEPRLSLPLQGLKAKVVVTGGHSVVHVTGPKGTERVAFPQGDRGDAEIFVRLLNKEVRRDAEFDADRKRQAAEIEPRIEAVRTETAKKVAELKRELDEVTKSVRRIRSEAAGKWLDASYHWQKQTGLRPRWIWRW
ncbi:hypothetical protein ACWD4G_03405 [Streptomyces sp. NPDC002643]